MNNHPNVLHYRDCKVCKTSINRQNPQYPSNPDRITLKNEDVCQEMRASSLFKEYLKVLTESPVKRIWQDFDGYFS